MKLGCHVSMSAPDYVLGSGKGSNQLWCQCVYAVYQAHRKIHGARKERVEN